jgi:DNA-binding MarR family transcriptional regulator
VVFLIVQPRGQKVGNNTGDTASSQGALNSEAEITLGLLNAVHENSDITQRSASHELGIALGLTNAYLKRCIKKGWIKVSQVPANRYAYYLTPKGFSEKTRLTAEYLSSSFGFFRKARNQCSEMLETCAAAGWQHVALAGAGDLCEVMTLCAANTPVELVGILDERFDGGNFSGFPVVGRLTALGNFDAVIVTDLSEPQATYDALVRDISPAHVLTLPLLKISREKSPLERQNLERQGAA